MESQQFYNLSFLCKFYSILLSSRGIEFESCGSVEHLADDDWLISQYLNFQIFLHIDVGYHVYIVLIPIDIDSGKNLLISAGPNNEFGNSLQFKIIGFVGHFFQMYFLLLLPLLLFDTASDFINCNIGCLILGSYLFFAASNSAHR